jgi:starch synthase
MLIPSKFEPCGLVQMIAMRYGALPVARSTGGLKDTIIHEVDGFLFNEYATPDFVSATHAALASYTDNREAWKNMVTKAITKDFSWDQSAKTYATLYQNLLLKND